MVEAVKSAAKVRAGQAGMLSRWGPPGTRAVRLDSLPVEVRQAVVTLVEAAKKASPVAVDSGEALEARRATDDHRS